MAVPDIIIPIIANMNLRRLFMALPPGYVDLADHAGFEMTRQQAAEVELAAFAELPDDGFGFAG
jgi:hypothetical protein